MPGVPGAGTEVPVEGAGGVVADLDRRGPAALAVHGDLWVPPVHVSAPGVMPVSIVRGLLGGGPSGSGLVGFLWGRGRARSVKCTEGRAMAGLPARGHRARHPASSTDA